MYILFTVVPAKADVSKIVGGATTLALGYGAVSLKAADGFEACCGAGAEPGCCMMAVSALGSAASLFANASDAHSIQKQTRCEDVMGAAFCKQGIVFPDITMPETPPFPGGTEPPPAEPEDPRNRKSNPVQFTNYNDFQQKTGNAIGAGLAEVATGLRELEGLGYKISPDGSSVQTPDGRSINMSQLASPGGPAAAGVSPEGIDALNRAIAAAKKRDVHSELRRLMQVEGGYAVGSGARAFGARSRGVSGTEPNLKDMLAGLLKQNQAVPAAARGPASFAGISKSVGQGDRIGVAADNIFHMVNRQYMKKQNSLVP